MESHRKDSNRFSLYTILYFQRLFHHRRLFPIPYLIFFIPAMPLVLIGNACPSHSTISLLGKTTFPPLRSNKSNIMAATDCLVALRYTFPQSVIVISSPLSSVAMAFFNKHNSSLCSSFILISSFSISMMPTINIETLFLHIG